MENTIKSLLCSLGISNEQSISQLYPQVRDRNDVAVMRCSKSGIIFLSRSDHIGIKYYENKQELRSQGEKDRKASISSGLEDAERRYEQFKYTVANRKWIDIGTGSGGILDYLSPISFKAAAVEPQIIAREELIHKGYNVYPSVSDVPKDDNYEVVSLFHVFEHFINPIQTLKEIRNIMTENGKLIIEVPHAKDFLIDFLDIEAFKAFTFWSEHLILHTRESLRIFIEEAGFNDISIKGYQRYPLANHLYWLAKKKPKGHIIWDHLRTKELEDSYSDMLSQINNNDTLIAFATK